MSRTGEFIYMRTMGYLDIDRDTNQVRTFVCVNTLVSEGEGKRLIEEMKQRFTIMIQGAEISSNEPDTPAVENPEQLERAIISLITNLQHRSDSECNLSLDGSPEADAMSEHDSDISRNAKSPPLELIPPKHSSIRTSIVRSIDVVGSSVKGMALDDSDDDEANAIIESSPSSVASSTANVQRNTLSRINDDAMPSSSTQTSPQRSVVTSSQVSFVVVVVHFPNNNKKQ